MPQFSLRLLFLLTSFCCLWFGAYAVWRDLVVFAIPLFAAIAATMGYLVISNKTESTRIKRVGLLTVANIVYGFAGAGLIQWLHGDSLKLSFLAFLVFIQLQTYFLSFHSFQVFTHTTQSKLSVLSSLLTVLNLLLAYVVFFLMLGVYHFMP